jgi:site-specific recombinase XerC
VNFYELLRFCGHQASADAHLGFRHLIQAAAALERRSHREYLTGPDDRVFLDRRGAEVLDYDAVARRRFKATRDRAGVASPRLGNDELSFHELRDSYATFAARMYGDPRDVQRSMGYASITTTEIYAHFLPRLDEAQRGNAGLAALLGEAPTTSTRELV